MNAGRIVRLMCLPVFAGLIIVGGCATPGPQQVTICPGKASVEEALATLTARSALAVPLKASGSCRLEYYDADAKKNRRHRVQLELWLQPPDRLYLQGHVGVVNKAVIVGSNDAEFWLGMRPEEISTFYWGRWEDAGNVEGLLINPRLVLEAFGIIVRPDAAVDSGLWSLDNEGAYDILTLRNEDGDLREKVYVYACDYLVHKIEYFDPDGNLFATAKLEDYTTVVDGFKVPRGIGVTTVSPEGYEDSMDVRFSFISEKELSPTAQEYYFSRNLRDMDEFENIFRYEDGQWIREK